jgi:hypothetical protein
MNPIELNRSLMQLRLSGMAAVLETRLLQAQFEAMAPIDPPHWTATASNMWNCSPRCHFSSSMTWECVSYH